jgi:hypothetical protein
MEDNIVLVAASFILLLLIAVATFKFSKAFGAVNFVIFLVYSSYMYYGLFFDNSDGTALAWWFYLLVVTILHILVTSVYLVKCSFKK